MKESSSHKLNQKYHKSGSTSNLETDTDTSTPFAVIESSETETRVSEESESNSNVSAHLALGDARHNASETPRTRERRKDSLSHNNSRSHDRSSPYSTQTSGSEKNSSNKLSSQSLYSPLPKAAVLSQSITKAFSGTNDNGNISPIGSGDDDSVRDVYAATPLSGDGAVIKVNLRVPIRNQDRINFISLQ